jgi:type I restriction enzyme S subunit
MPKISLNASKKTKYTPAGEIPVDWGCSPLESVAVVQTELSKSSNRSGTFVRLPYLRVANVQDGHFNLEEIKEIDVPKDQVDRFLVRKGDLLLTEGGDFDKLGRGAVWGGEIAPCAHQNHLFVVRGIEGVVDQRFLAAYTQSPKGKAYFQSCSKQSTNLASINSSQLKKLPVVLPPLPEQRKIADILSTWDEALETLDALIAAKTRQKQALMQQLLTGKARVKGAKGTINFVRASELFTNRSERNVEGLPILSVTQDQGVVLRSTLDRKITHDEETNGSYKVVRKGDFVISLRSFQGGLEYSDIEGAVSPAYHIIHPRCELDRLFFKHYFKSADFVSRLATAVIGIRDGKQINFTDFGFIKLPCPPVDDQRRIGLLLDTADQELTLLRTQRQTLDQQKRGLMQRLLTGKVRVTI